MSKLYRMDWEMYVIMMIYIYYYYVVINFVLDLMFIHTNIIMPFFIQCIRAGNTDRN